MVQHFLEAVFPQILSTFDMSYQEYLAAAQ